jgi:hypothetical protein
MVEEEVDQDSPEVYDEAYYDQVDYAHMAFHIPFPYPGFMKVMA